MTFGVWTGINDGVTLIMMLTAWNVSGGHFNPTITVGVLVATMKEGGKNFVMAGIMIVAQFAGAMFGILLGFLSLLDKQYMKELADPDSPDANVPGAYVGKIGPTLPGGGIDEGSKDDGYTRNWQTFWAVLIASTFLSLAYVSIKKLSLIHI